MLNRIASAAGMVLLASSIALGQTPPSPTTPRPPRAHQRVTSQAQVTTSKNTHRAGKKKHHKKHKKHKNQTTAAKSQPR